MMLELFLHLLCGNFYINEGILNSNRDMRRKNDLQLPVQIACIHAIFSKALFFYELELSINAFAPIGHRTLIRSSKSFRSKRLASRLSGIASYEAERYTLNQCFVSCRRDRALIYTLCAFDATWALIMSLQAVYSSSYSRTGGSIFCFDWRLIHAEALQKRLDRV